MSDSKLIVNMGIENQSSLTSLIYNGGPSPIIYSIELNVVDDQLKLNFAPMEALMQQSIDTNAVNGLTDIIDFNCATQGRLQQSGWRGSWSFMGESLRALTITPEVQTLLDDNNIHFLDEGELNYRQAA